MATLVSEFLISERDASEFAGRRMTETRKSEEKTGAGATFPVHTASHRETQKDGAAASSLLAPEAETQALDSGALRVARKQLSPLLSSHASYLLEEEDLGEICCSPEEATGRTSSPSHGEKRKSRAPGSAEKSGPLKKRCELTAYGSLFSPSSACSPSSGPAKRHREAESISSPVRKGQASEDVCTGKRKIGGNAAGERGASGAETTSGCAEDAGERKKRVVSAPGARIADGTGRKKASGSLPIHGFADAIRAAVSGHPVTLIVGDTGSGKTTQVPQFLYRFGFTEKGAIAVTQPRRVAAVSLARRVCEELGDEKGNCLGEFVGYSVRFEDKTTAATRIKFLTDGMLVREAMLDEALSRYSVIVLDEAHERSLRTDILLGWVKRLLAKRRDLKIVVMSATLDTEKFLRFFPGAKPVFVPGRQFPVEVLYTPEPEADYIDAALITTLQIHTRYPPGDILVFLPGQEDIEGLHSILEEKRELLRKALCMASQSRAAEASGKQTLKSEKVKDKDRKPASVSMGNAGVQFCIGEDVEIADPEKTAVDLLVCPLFAALPFDRQKAVFTPAPAGVRKVILATNIAETSITVQGIRYVVDSGLAKTKCVNHRTGVEALVIEEISQDSAKQRAGRAGREAPGTVFRMYTEDTFNKFRPRKVPEIVTCDLDQVFLELKALGIANPLEFPFLDAPPKEAFVNAGRTLHRLEAIDSRGELTELGRKLAALPLKPMLGKLLLDSVAFECTSEILSIVAMLSTDSLWNSYRSLSSEKTSRVSQARKRLADIRGDHLTLLHAYSQWEEATDKIGLCNEYGLHHNAMMRAKQIRSQLEELLLSPQIGLKNIAKSDATDRWTKVRQCLAVGCWLHTARLQRDGRTYVTTVERETAKLHPSSVLSGQRALPAWVVYSEYVHTSKPYLRGVTAIEGPWLQQFIPRWFTMVGQN
ncbi:helicase [Besnoitia besnoiti]|uniref:RNA helicase n=1 Tax=Besnoitia besnoiti TaxID=94643 RepID=A0A2A9M8R7_BESBE|nr:helicase [Besnoitia besnoiti]PFH33564.1 helicase [Besnoitia besnoiti]